LKETERAFSCNLFLLLQKQSFLCNKRERERERERERKKEKERQRKREQEREKKKERNRKREKEREKKKERKRKRDRNGEKQLHLLYSFCPPDAVRNFFYVIGTFSRLSDCKGVCPVEWFF
jgi:hypothetical protein